MPESETFPRVVKRNELRRLYGISPALAYKLMPLGQFPKTINWGTKNAGWLTEELDAWVAERKAARDAEAVAV